MTRYKLHESLGGGEFEGELVGPVSATVAFDLPGLDGRLLLPMWALTEVKPEWPEPEDRTVVRVTTVHGGTTFVAERDDAGRLHPDRHWFTNYVDGPGPKSWTKVTERAASVERLVPDPFADPVELPWRVAGVNPDSSTEVKIAPLYVYDISCNGGAGISVRLTEAAARAKARALWAAADHLAERGRAS